MATALGVLGPIVTELLGLTIWFWSAAALAIVASLAFWWEIDWRLAWSQLRLSRRLPLPVLWRLAMPGLVVLPIYLSWTVISGQIATEREQAAEFERRWQLVAEAVSGASTTWRCEAEKGHDKPMLIVPATTGGADFAIRPLHYVRVESSAPCEIVLSETAASDGQVMQLVSLSDHALTIRSLRGVQHLSSDIRLSRGDWIVMRYVSKPEYGGQWIEVNRVASPG